MSEFKVDDVLKVVGDSYCHGFKLGELVTVDQIDEVGDLYCTQCWANGIRVARGLRQVVTPASVVKFKENQ